MIGFALIPVGYAIGCLIRLIFLTLQYLYRYFTGTLPVPIDPYAPRADGSYLINGWHRDSADKKWMDTERFTRTSHFSPPEWTR